MSLRKLCLYPLVLLAIVAAASAARAQTYADGNILTTDPTFQARVRLAVKYYATQVSAESGATQYHSSRDAIAVAAVSNLSTWGPLFADVIASTTASSSCLWQATGSGTYVALTAGNVATQQALCTDVQLGTQVAANWNVFFNH